MADEVVSAADGGVVGAEASVVEGEDGAGGLGTVVVVGEALAGAVVAVVSSFPRLFSSPRSSR